MEEQIKKLAKLNEDNQEDYDNRLAEDMLNRSTKIVGVKYESKVEKGVFEGREYSYFTSLENPQIGDIVECPTKYGPSIGMITRLNVAEEEIKHIEKYMKNILIKYNRELYLQGKIEIEEVVRNGTED